LPRERSDFLRFVLEPPVEAATTENAVAVPCRARDAGSAADRPLVCYEYFSRSSIARVWTRYGNCPAHSNNAYANALAGRHILVVDRHGRIGARRCAHPSRPAGGLSGQGECGAAANPRRAPCGNQPAAQSTTPGRPHSRRGSRQPHTAATRFVFKENIVLIGGSLVDERFPRRQ